MSPEILYEDNHIIAVRKPAGILVQAGDRKSGNLMDEVKNYLKEKYKKPGNVFLGLVHRLDRPVSGIVLFAKTSKGASRLSEQFRNREVAKIYMAMVEGRVDGDGELIHYVRKDEEKLKSVVSEKEEAGYQKAELHYRSIRSSDKFSILEINLKTGRFNQIRSQLSHIGHPIAGDSKYGAKTKLPDASIALCAVEIEFKTATGGDTVKLRTDIPAWEKML